MSKELQTKYIPTNLRIVSAPVIPYREPSEEEIKYLYGLEGATKRREAHIAYNATLETIHIEDEVSKDSLFAQAISAVNSYPKERRANHPDFNAYCCFTEPNGFRFFVGDVKGVWDLENDTFNIQLIFIHHVCNSIEDATGLMSVIQSMNPGVPKIASDSFETALNATRQAS